MVATNFSKAKRIPSTGVSTKKSSPTTTNFAAGIYTYKPNDTMDYDEILLAQNARFDRIGEYATRHGLATLSEAPDATAGRVISVFEASISGVRHLLFVFKANTGATTLYRVDNSDNSAVVVRNMPDGIQHVRFCQIQDKIRYADGVEGPRLINPSNWSDTAIQTTDLDTGVDLQIKVSNILPGPESNILYFDADTDTQMVWTWNYNLDFAKEAEFMTTATLNKWVPGQTTTTTITKSTLTPVSETHLVSALAVGDYVLDGYGTYGEVTTISGNNVTVTAISHASESIASYDKFGVNFHANFPSINTGDPLTAMFNLGGIIYVLTRKHKYYFYSQAVDTWTQDTSPAQHGTFSQESVVCNLNYAYFADDDGVYVFDGSSESSLTQNTIQNVYDSIQNKDQITLDLFNNRLYVFYPSAADLGYNDRCMVYNINLKLWESFDTGLYVSSTTARQTASNRFICGSGTKCQLLMWESPNNDYSDQGAPIDFDLMTSYLHFGTPSQLHRISKWRPEFAKVSGDYTVQCGYALDFSDDVKYAFSINLHDGSVVSENYVWDNPPAYVPTTPTKLSTVPQINGEFHRVQIRYQHHAANEPVNFKSHTLTVQTQRIR